MDADVSWPEPGRRYTAIGLMSGTSLDGVDAALISTDGDWQSDYAAAITLPYPAAFRSRLRGMLGRRPVSGRQHDAGDLR